MSNRTESETRNERPSNAIDSHAAAASRVIAKLRHLLLLQDILEHPAVGGGLRKLDEQLIAQLTGQAGGRHRLTTSQTSLRPAGTTLSAAPPALPVPAAGGALADESGRIVPGTACAVTRVTR
jgi:hypothetical protein